MTKLQLWGGIECSHCRVGNSWSDQLTRNGHRDRISDLDAIAELGIRRLRYPVLWEHTAPNQPKTCDWSWSDARLPRLQELGIEPIIGLVHHGSGPRYTALNRKNFATGLARHASQVAQRYPWLRHYTPVNEPLTTARFSALYGLWYPHTTSDRTFVRALLNQLQATKLSMKAIREVNSAAQLIQTEDLGQSHGTPAMQEQVEFENHRRWLSFDILTGRVDRQHPLWDYLRASGATEAELLAWTDDPMPPDVLGINHYLTSERFLDDEFERYPPGSWAGHPARYADVEAIRVDFGPHGEMAGIQCLLQDAWQRYNIPLAVTEAHLGCTREEQMRWLNHVWQAAQNARQENGADVQAVTVWSLLGAYDWNSLLTREAGHYEPGVFDVRSGQLRPTALARMVQALASGKSYRHPVLDAPGWWQRDIRLHYRHHAEQLILA
jgi:beta-glucosidase/6-phospho-beta-glucosidase/beta-galactosidase